MALLSVPSFDSVLARYHEVKNVDDGASSIPTENPRCLPDKFARIARQADSPESFKFPIRANHATKTQKILLILSRSFRRETWHCSADIQGPLSVYLPELPIRSSEELKSAMVKLLEEDQRATTNVQNGLVFFFFSLREKP